MPFESRYDEPGTLPKPGPVGRLVRLVLGVACLYGAASAVIDGPIAIVPDLPHPANWIPTLLALWLLPAVVGIGWGVDLKRRSQAAVVIVGLLPAGVSFLAFGRWWARPSAGSFWP